MSEGSPTSEPKNPFEALLDAAVDAIAVIDEQGVLTRVNPALCKLFSYKPNELLGQNVKLLMTSTDRHSHDDYIQRYLRSGEKRIIGLGRETVGQRKNGEAFPLYLSVGHVTETGSAGFVGILRDLTAQRDRDTAIARTEMEIRQLRERLVHVARVSTLGEMVTGIAHEVNQPLTVIATYAQGCQRLIDGGLTDPSELLEALGTIANQAERAATVITRIRNFAKKTEIVEIDCDCAEILADVIALADVYARDENAEVVLTYDPNSPLMVRVDPIQVQQITLNLINNAIESMHETAGHKRVSVNIARGENSIVEVSVKDHGEGIAHDVADNLFDTFFTTKSDGMGIGLAICKSLIEAQGGKISARNNAGEPGATFKFTLPAAVTQAH
ncbi:MAG: PAS domain S-box protein [Halioglobus sp.]